MKSTSVSWNFFKAEKIYYEEYHKFVLIKTGVNLDLVIHNIIFTMLD